MILANSSKFSSAQQMKMSFKSGTGNTFNIPTSSQDCTAIQMHQNEFSRSRKRPTNASAIQSSSFSRRSIRKSTIEGGDVQEVTSFAHYVQDFFSNLFGCCQNNALVDKSTTLRNSLNSSAHSNLQYSFVAVPNNNNPGSFEGEGNQIIARDKGKKEYASRSRKI